MMPWTGGSWGNSVKHYETSQFKGSAIVQEEILYSSTLIYFGQVNFTVLAQKRTPTVCKKCGFQLQNDRFEYEK